MHTFGYIAEQLGKRNLAFIFTRESLGENRISPELKIRFGGMLIANEGFNRETAQQVIATDEADAIAFGKDFIPNPDLPHHLKLDMALNPYDTSTFYAYGDEGPTSKAIQTTPEVGDLAYVGRVRIPAKLGNSR